MKINFKAFTSILLGMTMIGLAIGFVIGHYLEFYFQMFYSDISIYIKYLAAPLLLGIGSGFVMHGALFEERK